MMHPMQMALRQDELTWADFSLSCPSTSNGAPSPPLRLIGPQLANHKNELPLDLRGWAEPGRRVASLLARVLSDT
jgi:hypothetical protein